MKAAEIQDIVAAGVAKYNEWERKFLDDWRRSIAEGNERKVFAMLPPALKEAMKQMNPEGYAQLQARMLRKRG